MEKVPQKIQNHAQQNYVQRNHAQRNHLQLKHHLLFMGLLLILCFSSFTVQAATPYSANGKLSIKGGKVVNAKGNTFVIKGVSTHGIAWYPEYINESAFKSLRDQWGVNTIRLALYTEEYNGYCNGGDKAKLKKYIDNGVKYATNLGMYVIIDWHILSDGNPLTNRAEAYRFFKKFAKKYAGYGNVMYEICNEPNGSGGSWKNIKSYANAVLKVIREVNKNAIVIVGTPTWSQDVDLANASKITGYSNVAYAFHFYAGTHQDAMRTKLESVLKKGLPVIVTEFGITDASGNGSVNKSQGNKWISLLNQYGVGRVCWNLSNKNESSALIKSSCSKKSSWTYQDLSEQGKWLVTTYKGKLAADAAKPTPTPTPKTTPKPSTTSTSKVITAKTTSLTSTTNAKVKGTLKQVNTWKSGGKKYVQYSMTIKNTGSTCNTWAFTLTFPQKIKLHNSWCAAYTNKGKNLTIKPLSWNKRLTKNQTTEIGFICTIG